MANADLVIAVLGKGEISSKTEKALLADRTIGHTPRFVFPVTDEHWTAAVRIAAQWALNREYPYDVILDGSETDLEAIGEVLEGAANSHRVASVETKLVSLLAEAQSDDCVSALLMAWDDKDDACQRALARAMKRDVASFDLLDGLNDLTFDDSPAPEPEHEDTASAAKAAKADREPAAVLEEPEIVAEPAKRTRRTKAQMQAARDEELAILAAEQDRRARQEAAHPEVDEAQVVAELNWANNGSQTVNGNDQVSIEVVSASNGNGHHDEIDVAGLVSFFEQLVDRAVAKAKA